MDKNTPPQDEQNNQSETLTFIDSLRFSLPTQDKAAETRFINDLDKTKQRIDYMKSSDKAVEGMLKHLDRKIKSLVRLLEVDFNLEVMLNFNKSADSFEGIDIITKALIENPKFSSTKGLSRDEKLLFKSIDAVRRTGKYELKHLIRYLKHEIKRSTSPDLARHILSEIKGRNDDETSIQLSIYTINVYHADIHVKRLQKLRDKILAAESNPPIQDIDEEVFKLLSSPTGFKLNWNNDVAALAYMFKQLTLRDADTYDPKEPRTALETTKDQLITFICQNFTHKGQPIKPGAVRDYIKRNKVPVRAKNIIDVDKLFEGL